MYTFLLLDTIDGRVWQASVPGIMEQDENGHHFRIAHQPITMVLALLGAIATSYRILFNSLSKTLLKSSQIKKISIILPSGNIAVVFIVCFSTTKLLKKIPLFS